MKNQSLTNLLKLRTIVGALGERQDPQWWATSFASETSEMFLKPIFSKTYLLAEYQGIKEAACRVHDEYIGTGNVYHLFRLPENFEYEMQNLALDKTDELRNLFENSKDSEFLLSEMKRFAGGNEVLPAVSDGPVSVGRLTEFSKPSGIEKLAQHYLAAVLSNSRVFPYFSE